MYSTDVGITFPAHRKPGICVNIWCVKFIWLLARTYKPWIGNCLLKLQLLWTLAKCEITSEILSVERLNRRAPAVKYNHTASSGGLWLLSGQRLHQQGAHKEMHIANNVQTLTPLIWWHCVWSYIISLLHLHMSVCQNIAQLKQQLCTDHCLYPGERDLTNIFRQNTEINGNTDLSL